MSGERHERGRARPRLGFLGLGWIGLARMQALIESGAAEVVALADPDAEALARAAAAAPGARACRSFDELLEQPLDGVVIATPSALHAAQAEQALAHGLAVFCQKPLGRDAREVRAVVGAAQRADRLLDVDLSYRRTAGMRRICELIRGGEIGDVYAAQLVFHNAYGPDKPWFYERDKSGGGALIDLGVHLIDLACWVLDFPAALDVTGRLYAEGRPLHRVADRVEDYASAQLLLAGDVNVELACSWRLHAGCDCKIEASFYGTRGGASFRNVGGSFYDFRAVAMLGTTERELAAPPDAWGGRSLVAWVERLARGQRFDPAVLGALRVAEITDRIYACEAARGRARDATRAAESSCGS